MAKSIAQILGLPLSSVEEHVFPDGERRIRIAESVVEEWCIVVQSTSTPVDSRYMELFFLIDGLRRSGASRVSTVVPYFGYQRQDHIFRDGEAVSLEVIISILSKLGIDDFISVDMHTSRIPDLFSSTIKVSHLSALPLFAKVILKEGWNIPEAVLVSPDMGGIRRIKILSALLDNMSWAAVEKNRDLVTGSLSENTLGEGRITGAKIGIIVDDMVASGNTMVKAAELIKKEGIERVYTFATHAVFSHDAPILLERSGISKIFVTDSVYIPEEKKFKKLTVLPLAKTICQGINALQ